MSAMFCAQPSSAEVSAPEATVRPSLAAMRCGSPVPPHQTSILGLPASARIWARTSPVDLRTIATSMPVSASKFWAMRSHQACSFEQTTLRDCADAALAARPAASARALIA
jgi:hypothetical protein